MTRNENHRSACVERMSDATVDPLIRGKNPYARLPSLSEVAADTIYLENAPVRYDGRPYIVSIGYKMNAIKKRLH